MKDNVIHKTEIKTTITIGSSSSLVDINHMDEKNESKIVLGHKLRTNRDHTYRYKSSNTKSHRRSGSYFVVIPPSKKEEDRLQQMISIASACRAKRMIYSDELYYPETRGVYRHMNKATLDQHHPIQKLSLANLAAFSRYKEMCSRGFYPPIEVRYCH